MQERQDEDWWLANVDAATTTRDAAARAPAAALFLFRLIRFWQNSRICDIETQNDIEIDIIYNSNLSFESVQ
jgi:hypothetical protein